jgi:large subunit ribosomal protein L10
MDKAGKAEILGTIKEEFANVQSVIVAHYAGVTVPKVTAIRDDFRKAGCHYQVIKNTLVKIAVKDTSVAPMTSLLAGPTAFIWSHESPSAPAKLAVKWAKDQKDKFQIKGGYFEGQVLDQAGVQQLSEMPGKPELQAFLLMTFLAAPTDLVRTLAAGPMNFLYLLQARERALGGS